MFETLNNLFIEFSKNGMETAGSVKAVKDKYLEELSDLEDLNELETLHLYLGREIENLKMNRSEIDKWIFYQELKEISEKIGVNLPLFLKDYGCNLIRINITEFSDTEDDDDEREEYMYSYDNLGLASIYFIGEKDVSISYSEMILASLLSKVLEDYIDLGGTKRDFLNHIFKDESLSFRYSLKGGLSKEVISPSRGGVNYDPLSIKEVERGVSFIFDNMNYNAEIAQEYYSEIIYGEPSEDYWINMNGAHVFEILLNLSGLRRIFELPDKYINEDQTSQISDMRELFEGLSTLSIDMDVGDSETLDVHLTFNEWEGLYNE